MCQTYQSFRDSFVDWSKVSDDEGHQVGTHVDTGLFKLVLQEVWAELCGFSLRHISK